MSHLTALLRYRLLHEFRQALRGTAWNKLKLLLLVLAPLFGIFIVGGYYAYLVQSAETLLSGGDYSRQRVLDAGLLIAGAIGFLIMFMETLQQVWFGRESQLLSIAPISFNDDVVYRSFFALLRSAPWVGLFLMLPAITVSAFPRVRPATLVLIVSLTLLYWVWLAAVALGAASLILAVSNRWRIGRHGLYAVLYLLQMLVFIYVFLHLGSQAGWVQFIERLDALIGLALLPSHQIALMTVQVHTLALAKPLLRVTALIASLGCPALLSYFVVLRLWHWATRPASAANVAGGVHWSRMRAGDFSTNPSWAIFQKDYRDLLRNPVYRNSLIASFILLAVGLWVQARRSGSSSLLASTLTLIYMAPLLVSARAARQESGLLELYKLVLPNGYNLLDAKLCAQAVINVAVTLAAALPFFLMLKPGFDTFIVCYFAGATILFVPLLTALALALGTYFPDLSSGPSVLGIKVKGLLPYVLLGGTLYSFLLNRMYLGAGIYYVFLAAITAASYVGARRRLYSLIERRTR